MAVDRKIIEEIKRHYKIKKEYWNDTRVQDAFKVEAYVTKVNEDSLFVEVFRNYITKHKSVFYDLSLEKRIDYIENAIHKDMKFRNSVKGMVIGQFTVDEYKMYARNSSALNKRMMNMVKDRLLSSIQLFEKPEGILQAI